MHVPSKVSTIKIITPDTTEMAITVVEFDGGLPEEDPFANSNAKNFALLPLSIDVCTKQGQHNQNNNSKHHRNGKSCGRSGRVRWRIT